jgi:hypothetical protein
MTGEGSGKLIPLIRRGRSLSSCGALRRPVGPRHLLPPGEASLRAGEKEEGRFSQQKALPEGSQPLA